MKTKEFTLSSEDQRELNMLMHAKCNCSMCMAEKNRLKQKVGEKQFNKICDQIKHSHIH